MNCYILYDNVVKQFSALMYCSCRMLTHLQVLVEEAELTEALQVMVLLPAAVQTLRMIPGTSAHPPVTQPATHRQMYKTPPTNTWKCTGTHIMWIWIIHFLGLLSSNRHYIHYIPWSCNGLWPMNVWLCHVDLRDESFLYVPPHLFTHHHDH